jgi:hypothetical protein
MSEQTSIFHTDETWSCTSPASGLVQLTTGHNKKIVQVACVQTSTLKLPSSSMYGFCCMVVITSSAGQDLVLDLNNQTLVSCLNGLSSGTILLSPVVGTRLQIRCDGSKWFVNSDYAKSLPPILTTNSSGFIIPTPDYNLVSSNYENILTNLDGVQVSVGGLSISFIPIQKGKIYKIVCSKNGGIIFAVLNDLEFSYSIITHANDSRVSPITRTDLKGYFGFEQTTDFILSCVGDSFLAVNNGSQWYVCGSTNANFANPW